MNPCDLIINCAYLLPVAPENTVLTGRALAISEGKIISLGTQAEISSQYTSQNTVNLDHHIVMPGLVNAHGHAAMTLLRGSGEDQALQEWLSETIWPLEGRLVNEGFVQLGTELAIAEMMQSGTTTFSDMYFFPEVAAQTAMDIGMRAQIAFPVIEMPNIWSESVSDGLHKGLALHDTYRHNPLVNIAFGPHAAYTVSEENLTRVGMYASEIEAGIQIHLHENAKEVTDAHSQLGKSHIAQLNELGLLNPSLQAVHMTQVSPEDLELLVNSGTSVVHCPSSNLKLASGYCPVHQLQDADIVVGLGTDGAASNNGLDMFKELHLASLLAKHHTANPEQGNAQDTIKMATLDSATVLGLQEDIGSLEPGKFADVIAVDINAAGMQPMLDPFATLTHGNCGAQVSHVWIAGLATLEKGKLMTINQVELLEKVNAFTQQHF